MINNQPSELRGYLNALAQQMTPDAKTEVEVVFKTCQLIAMYAGDKSKPMPVDVFAFDLDDTLCRGMLAAVTMVAMRSASVQAAAQAQANASKIVVPKSKTA